MAAVKSVIQETQSKFGYIKGKSMWAKVLEPGEFGKFEVNLYPDEDTLNDFIAEMELLRGDAENEVKEAGKKISGLADVFKEDNDGNRYIAFKLNESNYKGEPNKVDFYDVTGSKVPDWDTMIGNGSLIKVKYMAKPYYMASTKMVGISYKFFAVQVIKLEEYAGADDGFGDETSSDEPF